MSTTGEITLAVSAALLSACTSQGGGTPSSAPASVSARSPGPSTATTAPAGSTAASAAGPAACASADLAVALTPEEGGGA